MAKNAELSPTRRVIEIEMRNQKKSLRILLIFIYLFILSQNLSS